jgi:hypothetical protein
VLLSCAGLTRASIAFQKKMDGRVFNAKTRFALSLGPDIEAKCPA